MRLATAQSLVSGDLAANALGIRELIKLAAEAGADLVHFPESSLSGFVGGDIPDWQSFDWTAYEAERAGIQALCAANGIAAVIGGPFRDPAVARPFNALFVISADGEIAARYDKRFCSHNEISYWYASAQLYENVQKYGIVQKPLCVEIAGARFGFVLCIEVNFPELFLAYERVGITALLFSSSHAKSEMFRIQAQGHAACNNYWISYSVPVHSRQRASSSLIGPDGRILDACPAHVPGLVVNEIDPAAPEWDVPLNKARPWRRSARKGEIYAASRDLR